jgi:hypothetical protein
MTSHSFSYRCGRSTTYAILRDVVHLFFALLVLLAATGGGAWAQSDLAFFETPSRNIYCVYSGPDADSPDGSVECEIYRFQPSYVQSYTKDRWSGCYPLNTACTPDKLSRYVISSGSSMGDNSCGCEDLVNCFDFPAACQDVKTLEYGTSFRRDGLVCSSEKEGLTCKNTKGHGFFLSKAEQKVF